MSRIISAFLVALLCLSFYHDAHAQSAGGTSCAASLANPALVNVTYQNVYTCGKFNNFSTYNGQDYLYYYCAPADGCLTIDLLNVEPGDIIKSAMAILAIADTCYFGNPVFTNSLNVAPFTSGNLKTTINVEAGKCYYFLCDVNDMGVAWADCIDFDFLLSFYPKFFQTPGNELCSALTITDTLAWNAQVEDQTLCCVGNTDASTLGNDWFYNFYATSSGCVILDIDSVLCTDNSASSQLDVRVGSCGSTIVSSVISTTGNNYSSGRVRFSVIAGNYYHLAFTTPYMVGLGGCINYEFNTEFIPQTTQLPGTIACVVDTSSALPSGTYIANHTTCCVGNNINGAEKWHYNIYTPVDGCVTVMLLNVLGNNGSGTAFVDISEIFCAGAIATSGALPFIDGVQSADTLILRFDGKKNTSYIIQVNSAGYQCFNYDLYYEFDAGPAQWPGGNTLPVAAQLTNMLVPGSYYGQTTCCLVNNEGGGNGQDWLYTFVAQENMCVRIAVDSFINGHLGALAKAYISVVDVQKGTTYEYTYQGITDILAKGPELFLSLDSNGQYIVSVDVQYNGANLIDTCINYELQFDVLGFTASQTPGGQTPPEAAANALTIGTNYTGQTTCCMHNDTVALEKGEDWWYTFCAPTSGCYKVIFRDLSSASPILPAEYVVGIVKDSTPNFIATLGGNLAPGAVMSDSLKIVADSGACYHILMDGAFGHNDRYHCYNYSIEVVFIDSAQQFPGGNDSITALANELTTFNMAGNQTTCCMLMNNGIPGQDWIYTYQPGAHGIYQLQMNVTGQAQPTYFSAALSVDTFANSIGSNVHIPIYWQQPGSNPSINYFFCGDSTIGDLFINVNDLDNNTNSFGTQCINYEVGIVNFIPVPKDSTYVAAGANWQQSCNVPIAINTQYDSICMCCYSGAQYFTFCPPSKGCINVDVLNYENFYTQGSGLVTEVFELDANCNPVGGALTTFTADGSADFVVDANKCYGIRQAKDGYSCIRYSLGTTFIPYTIQTPGGTTVLIAQQLPAMLNTTYTNQKNCLNYCESQNIHDGSAIPCTGTYTPAKDFVYMVVPGQIGQVTIAIDSIDNLSGSATDVMGAVYGNSALNSNVASGTASLPGFATAQSLVLQFWCQSPSDTFYFVMDATGGQSSCIQYDFTITQQPFAFGCNNADFEYGNATNWQLSVGSSLQGDAAASCPSPQYSACPSLGFVGNGHHTITTGGTDYFGGFSTVGLGNYSLRLGDTLDGGQGEGAQLLFAVDATNSVFRYAYAVVFEDPGHAPTNQPFFRAKVVGPDGSILQCTEYCVAANGAVPGFAQSMVQGSVNVFYKPWTDVYVDLTDYIGMIVSIQFENGDCSDGSHFGYSYIDCSCEPQVLNDDLNLCIGMCDTLFAPLGYTNYVWQPSGDTGTYKVVCPTVSTTYTLQYNTYTNCVLAKPYSVNILQDFTVSINQVCALGGSITAVPSDTTGVFSYSWSTVPINNTNTVANVMNGTTYTVTVSDDLCYTHTATITANINTPSLTLTSVNNVQCFGFNNGIATVATSAGTAPYTYQVNAGAPQAGSTFNNLAPGLYTIAVTDQGNCKDTVQLTITEPLALSANVLVASNCAGGNGVLAIGLPGGGVPSYNYAWTGTVSTNDSVYLALGNHILTVSDANACSVTTSFVVVSGLNPTINIIDTVQCDGSANASAVVQMLGGVGTNISITWNTIPLQTNDTAINLAAGTFIVTLSDAFGCSGSATVEFVDPDPIIIGTSAEPTCYSYNNGSVDAIVTPAQNGYSYLWQPGAYTTSQVLLLPDDVYTLTVTNASGCTESATAVVNSLPLPLITILPNQDTFCQNQLVNLTISGPDTIAIFNSDYTQVLSTYLSADSNFVVHVVGTNINGCSDTLTKSIAIRPTVYDTISAQICFGNSFLGYTTTGTFTDVFISSSGCDSFRVLELIVNPLPVINVSYFPNDTVCEGTSTMIIAGSGAQLYTWQAPITNGVFFQAISSATYTVTAVSFAGCTSTSTAQLTVLPNPVVTASALPSPAVVCIGDSVTLFGSGAPALSWSGGILDATPFAPLITTTYFVVGTDASGCTSVSSLVVTVNALPVVGASAVPDTSVCIGDMVALAGIGASSYTWSGGVLNAVPFTPTSTNTYTVTGTDANMCTSSSAITVVVNSLPTLTVTTIPNPAVLCAFDTLILTASGAPTIAWSNGVVNGVASYPSVSNVYTVTGTDINGCTTTATAPVTVNPLPAVQILSYPGNYLCIGDTLILHAIGAPLLQWQGAVADSVPFVPQATSTYSVLGTSSFGCTKMAIETIVVSPLPVVGIQSIPAPAIICLGDLLTLTAQGAATYQWTGGVVNAAPFLPTASGTYTVTGVSAAGCTSTNSISITVQPLPVVTIFTPNDTVCESRNTSITASGANQYQWLPALYLNTNIGSTVICTPSTTTAYVVIGTDTNTNCKANATVTITVLDTFVRSIKKDICDSDTLYFDKDLIVQTGVYTKIFKSRNGCDSTVTWDVTIYPKPSSILQLPPFACVLDEVRASIIEPKAPIQHVWNYQGGNELFSFGDTAKIISWTMPGVYYFYTTSSSNAACPSVYNVDSIVIYEAQVEIVNLTVTDTFACSSLRVLLKVDPQIGYVYNWKPTMGADSMSFAYSNVLSQTTTIQVLATEPHGCTASDSILMPIIECCELYMPNAFTPNQDGVNEAYGPKILPGVQLDLFSIYNRYGQLVFTTSNPNQKWIGTHNGKDCDAGVYFYYCRYKCANIGTKIVTGDVTLIR